SKALQKFIQRGVLAAVKTIADVMFRQWLDQRYRNLLIVQGRMGRTSIWLTAVCGLPDGRVPSKRHPTVSEILRNGFGPPTLFPLSPWRWPEQIQKGSARSQLRPVPEAPCAPWSSA